MLVATWTRILRACSFVEIHAQALLDDVCEAAARGQLEHDAEVGRGDAGGEEQDDLQEARSEKHG